jgi:threonylcarbamoyladenosine tRNA methylthiotransferase MtaB
MTIDVITFGCRLNTHESEVMRKHAHAAGLHDVIILNTCAVTAEAEKQARQSIRKLRREHPQKRIVVTGCAAQIDPARYVAMEEVDVVLGNQEKLEATSWQFDAAQPMQTSHDTPWGSEKARVNDIMSVKETASHLVSSFEGRSRAFLQVQNGCNHRCTFCIIPYGRGNSRSVPVGEVVTQARMLVEAGYNELVITGVDISDYGKDLPGAPSLGQLVRRLLAQVPELKRLRLSSIDAVEVDETLLRLFAEEERLMPHLHLSVQAGDDMILKRMKRRHLRGDILRFCAQVKSLRPDIVFGADMIAGFPTETDAMFANSAALIEEVGFAHLHVFPYSARVGTPAAKMPQVPKPLRKERAAQLRRLGEIEHTKYLQACIGKRDEVVVEQTGGVSGIGRTRGFALAEIPAHYSAGMVLPVAITAAQGSTLIAEVLA